MDKKQILGEVILFVSFILLFVSIFSYLTNNTNFIEQVGKSLIENKSAMIGWQTIITAIIGFVFFILGFVILGKGIKYIKNTWLLLVIDLLNVAPITLLLLAVFLKNFYWWFRASLIVISIIFYVILRVAREDAEEKR